MRIILIFLFFIKILFAVDVLILNSYSVQFPWTKGEVEGILKNLKNRNLEIYIEFMDTKIFKPTPEYLNNENIFKIEPLILSQIIFFILENCDKITINILQNELKININSCGVPAEEMKKFFEIFHISNISVENNDKNLIITIKN